MTSPHGQGGLAGLDAYCKRGHSHHDGDRFGRLFADLPPLFTDPRVLENLGRPDGPMADDKAETTSVAVGLIFFGQFLDHDITLDISSSLDTVNDPATTGNVRTPSLDLDCIYGLGPDAQPYLYHADGPYQGVKLITGAEHGTGDHRTDDLARVGEVALIGDFRNDENRAVSQVQLSMIRAHNRFCEDLHGTYQGKALYEKARERCSWHYQWCVVHDYLAKICGKPVVDRVLAAGRQVYKPCTPFIPVEFSVAAYRFGHAMVPMEIQFQKGNPRFELFGEVYGRGFESIKDPRAVADIHELFETHEGRQVQRASRCDTKLAKDLLKLSARVDSNRQSLATRNMIRGQSFLLPSGESVARELGRDAAEIGQISAAARNDEPGLTAGTPLWYYILKEAEIIGREEPDGSRSPGEGLGPVGATIVAETIIGLIELDSRSWLGSDRNWRPETYSDDATVEISTVGHLLAYR